MSKPSPTPNANSSIYDDLKALSSQEIEAILDDKAKSKDKSNGDVSDDDSSSKNSADDSQSESTANAVLSQDQDSAASMAVETLGTTKLIDMLVNPPSLKSPAAELDASPSLPLAQRACHS